MRDSVFNELRIKLTESIASFPHVYMFKFIIKADNHTLALIQALFDDDADIKQSVSSKGSYISVTVRQVVLSVDDIIATYEKAAEIKGVMSL